MRTRRRTVVTYLNQHNPADDTPPDDGLPVECKDNMPKKQKHKSKKSLDDTASELDSDVDDGSDDGLLTKMRRRVFRPKYLLLVAAVLLAAVAAPRFRDWLPDPGKSPNYQLETAKIEITTPPRDVPPNLVAQVVKRAQLPESVSILDDTLTERIAAAFASHPWVKKVVSVRKAFPPSVTVELEYRRPIAMVEVPEGMYPIDESTVLLPPDDFSLADTRRYPVIRGVQTLPQGPAGEVWDDVAVTGAARIAVALQTQWPELQLEAIVVPRRTAATEKLEDLKFVLLTRKGSRIIWGRPPGTNHPGELTADQKLGRLKKYLTDFGRFDQPHGPYEIDIRHWQEITRRPISASGFGVRR